MSRRPQDTKDITRRPQGIKDVRDAREKADAARKRLVERVKDQHLTAERERQVHAAALEVKRKRFSELSIDNALAAARRLAFLDLESEKNAEAAHLNRPSLALLEQFLKALQDRQSVAVLQWPRGVRDISILHPLAMLATLDSAPERVTGGYSWCPPVPDFRTLYYPWRGSGTGITQRRILVDRHEITKRNQLHLTRSQVNESEFSPELRSLHITLGHLNQLKLRDTTKPHLAHPTLGELYPTFGALGGENAPAPFTATLYELFGRVRHGAALDKLQDYRAEICRPATAPFALFGVCPRSPVKRALQHTALAESRGPDICLVDLSSAGLHRLGPDWEGEIEKFLSLLAANLPETPALAVTQDIYVHRRFGHLLAAAGLAERPSSTGRTSRVLVRSSDDCFAPDPDVGEVTEVQFRFHSAGGQGAAALRALSDTAWKSSDPAVAGILRHTMGNLRRTMSLPCGLRAAHEVLVETADGFLERRSAGTVLATVRKQLDLCADGAERERLASAERMIDAAFTEFEEDTPVGSLLAEAAASMGRKSSPSVIAFATDHELALGRQRICTDDEDGERIKSRLESGFIRLTTLQALDLELSAIESDQNRNSWKRLLLVAPPRDQFAVLLGRKWLPEEIIVLSDREFVDRLAGVYAALATHPDLAGPGRIGSRLAKAAAAAKAEAKARDVPAVDLELETHAPTVADESVIDLTSDEIGDDDREVVELGLESGRTMRVRPGGLVIRHDRFADVNPFERAVARDIARGNTIVVPNQAFVQEARTVLPVRILAQTRVQIYHTAVEAALPGIPGASRAAKARHVIECFRTAGARTVVEATVLDWLNAGEHKLAPAERLRPHAPQNWREFKAFMDVIHVPPALAESIWREGIEPLRIDRRRAGARMAQAFVSVLVDPHGGAGALSPEVRGRIARLRRQAMEHLDGVLTVTRHDPQPDLHA